MARRHVHLGPELDAKLRELASKFSTNTSKLLRRGAELAIAEYTALLAGPVVAAPTSYVSAPTLGWTDALKAGPVALPAPLVEALAAAKVPEATGAPIPALAEALAPIPSGDRACFKPRVGTYLGMFDLMQLCNFLGVDPVDAANDITDEIVTDNGTGYVTLDGLNEVCALAHHFELADKVKAWALTV